MCLPQLQAGVDLGSVLEEHSAKKKKQKGIQVQVGVRAYPILSEICADYLPSAFRALLACVTFMQYCIL